MKLLYTTDEVAARLKLHPATVRRRIIAGTLNGFKTNGGYRVRYRTLRGMVA